MKTSFEFVQLVWQRLKGSSELSDAVGSRIYKFKRPDGSHSVDVVVNGLAFDNEQLQEGVVNVNVHAPNLQVTIEDQPDNSQPDIEKLDEVSKIILDLLNDYWNDEFHCHVQSNTIIEEPDLKENFSNIRVNVFSINL